MSVRSAAQTHVIQSPESASQLQQTLQQCGVECAVIENAADCQLAPACYWLGETGLNQTGRLAGALHHTISVLEHTRHAFKSKQLAQLREHLEELLKELQQERLS